MRTALAKGYEHASDNFIVLGEIKMTMMETGLSKRELTEVLGVYRGLIRLWERGRGIRLRGVVCKALKYIRLYHRTNCAMIGYDPCISLLSHVAEIIDAYDGSVGKFRTETLGMASMSRLAKKLGVDERTVAKWERGLTSVPTYLWLALKWLEVNRKNYRI